MAFVDIFNFKKYITKPSDATTARIGHVNALYDALANSDSAITKNTYLLATGETDVTINTKSGVIEIEDDVLGLDTFTFNIISADITADNPCVILITPICDEGFNFGLRYVLSEGEADITIYNRNASNATLVKLHFLII